jgi:RNA polymerase sigma-70 factor (ECF subfamily)
MNISQRSDLDLLGQLAEDDQAAFNEIYRRHYPLLYKVAFSILEDREVSKDVIQDSFLSLYEKGRGTVILNLQRYLTQVVRYQCFMHLRSGRISQRHRQEMSTSITSNTLQEELDLKDLQYLLSQGIAALPDKCREVFYLSRFEALSNKKIAEHLQISHKTVENQLTKALRHLHVSVGSHA